MHTGLVDADVVVIGVGAIGLSAALHRVLLGRSAVVVERFVEQASRVVIALKVVMYVLCIRGI